jgi:hypothetical protein
VSVPARFRGRAYGSKGRRTMVMTDQKPATPSGNHPKRRLSDKIVIAFHHACDQTDIEAAWERECPEIGGIGTESI